MLRWINSRFNPMALLVINPLVSSKVKRKKAKLWEVMPLLVNN